MKFNSVSENIWVIPISSYFSCPLNKSQHISCVITEFPSQPCLTPDSEEHPPNSQKQIVLLTGNWTSLGTTARSHTVIKSGPTPAGLHKRGTGIKPVSLRPFRLFHLRVQHGACDGENFLRKMLKDSSGLSCDAGHGDCSPGVPPAL